jgi:hypothetical protein
MGRIRQIHIRNHGTEYVLCATCYHDIIDQRKEGECYGCGRIKKIKVRNHGTDYILCQTRHNRLFGRVIKFKGKSIVVESTQAIRIKQCSADDLSERFLTIVDMT